MPRWSALSGTPRPGEEPRAPGGPRATDAHEAARSIRRAALVASGAVLWGLSGALAAVLATRAPPVSLLLLGALPLAVAGALLLGVASRVRRPSAARTSGALLLTLAAAFATAGHLLHPRGASMAPYFAPHPAWPAWLDGLLLVGALLVVPLVAATRVHALRLGLDAGGVRPKWIATPRALVLGGTDDILAPPPTLGRATRVASRRLRDAFALPGLLLTDVLLTILLKLPHREARDRMRLDVAPEAVAQAVHDAGFEAEVQGARVLARLPQGSVRATRVHVELPSGDHPWALELAGPRDAVVALRRLLEDDLRAGWSCLARPARRLEARLQALAREAHVSVTLAERAVLAEETRRVERRARERHLSPDDRDVLLRKALRLQLHLAQPPPATGAPAAMRLAEGPILPPSLPRVLDAGGLGAVQRVVFAPHWIAPVATEWGELDALVATHGGRPDLAEGRRLLDAATKRGTGLALEPPEARLLPAPTPTGALLAQLRAALPMGSRLAGDLDALETVYVPFVPSAEGGYVNAVTGTRAPEGFPHIVVAAR